MPSVNEIISEAVEFTGASRFSTTRTDSLLNKSYDKILGMQLWPFLEITATSVSVSSGAWTVPADLRAIISVTNRTANVVLREESPRAFAARVGEHGSEAATVTSGQSALYYRVEGGLPGGTVTNWPSDSAAVFVQYFKDHDVLAAGGAESTILIPIRFHDVLSAGLNRELFLIQKDYESAVVWAGLFAAGVVEMTKSLFASTPGNAIVNPLLDEEGSDGDS